MNRLDAATAHYFGEDPVQEMRDIGGGGGGDGFPDPVVNCSLCGLQLCLKKTSRGTLDGGMSGKSGLCSSHSLVAKFCEGGFGGGDHLQLMHLEASEGWAGLIKGSVGAALS